MYTYILSRVVSSKRVILGSSFRLGREQVVVSKVFLISISRIIILSLAQFSGEIFRMCRGRTEVLGPPLVSDNNILTITYIIVLDAELHCPVVCDCRLYIKLIANIDDQRFPSCTKDR